MPALEGFSPLGKVGLVNKGVYSEGNGGPFDKYDFVQYGTNTYMATQDGVSGPPGEGKDGWQLLAKGVTGTAASISGATVEVDNGVGEPSARVEVSGEDTNRTFAFHFNNLKGETGEQGPEGAQGLQGEQGERGPQGLQGEQGVGVSSLAIDDQKHLKVTLTDENTVDAGAIALNKEAIVEGLGYEPAGGKNLVLDSAQEISNANYLISKYTLSEPFKLNKTYTITIWGELAEGKVGFSAYVGSDENDVSANLKEVSDGVYSGICRKSSWFNGNEPNTEILMIFSSPGNVNKISNIHRIKLEPGINPNPIWTPAPEDVATKNDLEPIPFNVTFEDGFNGEQRSFKLGRIVVINLRVKTIKPGLSGEYVIGYVPEELIPKAVTYLGSFYKIVNGKNIDYMYITENGSIKLGGGTSDSPSQIFINSIYYV